MTDGPTMSAYQPAGSAVVACPYSLGSHGTPPKWKTPRQKIVPCDIRSIEITLHAANGTTVSVIGTTSAAHPDGLPDVDARTNTLLSEYAAVIQFAAPARFGDANGALDTNPIDEMNADKLRGKVTMRETMRANCGNHAEVIRAPSVAETPHYHDPRAYPLEVSTQVWTFTGLIKSLFGGADIREFVSGQRKAVAFDANSCGWVTKGNPVGSLSGIVEMVIADQWVITFRWAQGFAFKFGAKSSYLKDLRDGTHVRSQSRSSQRSGGAESETKSTTMTQGDNTIYTSRKNEDGTVTISDPNSASAERGAADQPTETSATKKLEAALSAAKGADFNRGLQLNVSRNGKTMLDTTELATALEDLINTISTISDFFYRLTYAFEEGARAGIPVSITFGFDLDFRVFKGDVDLRIYPEMTSPKQSSSYYISGYRPRFELGINLELFYLSLNPSITFSAKFIHEAVASLVIQIDATVTGSAYYNNKFRDGGKSDSRVLIGAMRGSIKGTGTITLATFYVKGEGEARSGIQWRKSIDFNGLNLKFSKGRMRSHRFEFTLAGRYGNKIWDKLGLGSDDPDWQWPPEEQGPCIWLEENAVSCNIW
jgi:hypothetical protein